MPQIRKHRRMYDLNHYASVVVFRRNERARIVMATRSQATNGSSSDKQYYSASLVRNLAGSIVLQSEKLPWTKDDDACNPHAARCYNNAVDRSQRSPLLTGPGISPGISPPPYCHSRRRLPCGCDAYVDVTPDLSISGQDLVEGTSCRRLDTDPATIYYVLDPQKHASHRSRNQPTMTTTTSASGTRPREPEEDGGDDHETNKARSLVLHRAGSVHPAEVEGEQNDREAVTPSRYPEVVSDCEQSIQNDGQIQYGSTL